MNVPYEESETSSQTLAYKFLDAYDDCLNRDDFINKVKDECPDLGIVNAIWEIIDLLTLGGR